MPEYIGSFVCSRAGRDKGSVFCVLGREGEFLLLADGKRRRVEHPKRKKERHVSWLSAASEEFHHPVIEQLKEGITPSNRGLRAALAAFRGQARRE